jgi:hypothetical protein
MNDKLQSRALLLGAYSSVIPPRSATYCSAPVTSGKYYFEWLERTGKRFEDVDAIEIGSREAHSAAVIEANRSHSLRVVGDLRRNRSYVIDPSAVAGQPGWTQADWLDLWEEVIALYASEVVFVDGWEYSYGCVHEFWFAQTREIPTYDERGQPLTRTQSLEMISAAARDIGVRGGPVAPLERVLEALKELP